MMIAQFVSPVFLLCESVIIKIGSNTNVLFYKVLHMTVSAQIEKAPTSWSVPSLF